MEIIIASLSAVLGVLIYSKFLKKKADDGQKNLEIKSAVINTKIDNIKEDINNVIKQEKEDVAEITKEQAKPVSNSDLVDFFDSRNKPK
jgi:CRISPR/Cas system CMR subunit Cmr6 (Cas7 group RAMP superfamily)